MRFGTIHRARVECRELHLERAQPIEHPHSRSTTRRVEPSLGLLVELVSDLYEGQDCEPGDGQKGAQDENAEEAPPEPGLQESRESSSARRRQCRTRCSPGRCHRDSTSR